MDSSFGTRLREQRERQNVSLRAIADQTKIKISLLEDLERDDVSHWPSGIYRRSYFRVYAQAIGLDPDSSVREFLERHPDPNDDQFPSATIGDATVGGRPPTRLRYLIDSAVGAMQPVLKPTTAWSTAQAGVVTPWLRDARNDGQSKHAASIAPPILGADKDVDFTAVAQLCTRLSRVANADELALVLEEVTAAVDAVGVILWTWDPNARALVGALSNGYSDEVLRQLPRVAEDSEAAIAAAFREGTTLVVPGTDAATGAVVAPLTTPAGCTGVLAIELPSGVEQREDVRAASTILAAQIATLVESPALTKTISA
jgi:transcriptional regulator with XRE-family HTH domain